MIIRRENKSVPIVRGGDGFIGACLRRAEIALPKAVRGQWKLMKRVDLYIKVEVELDEEENQEKLAREICRVIQKVYAVRRAELSSAVARD